MSATLPNLEAVEQILAQIRDRQAQAVELVGPWGSAKTLAAVQTARALNRPLFIISPGRIEAEAIYDDLVTFAGEDQCALFPAWEVLPGDAMDPSDDIIAERMNTLLTLAERMKPAVGKDAAQAVMHVVAPVRSLAQRVVQRATLTDGTVTLELGTEYDLDALLEKLVKMGYKRELMVEQRGQMSVRGGIFDVFPISSELPYRIEFFGDEIDSIRRFEPETQRSVDKEAAVRIVPQSEKRLLAQNKTALATLLDYFPDNALIALDEPLAVAEEARKLEPQFGDSPYFMPWRELKDVLAAYTRLDLAQVAFTGAGGVPRVTTPMRSLTSWEGHTGDFWEQLTRWDADKYSVTLHCTNTGSRQRLLELLDEKGYRLDRDTFDLQVALGRLRAGFDSPNDKLAVLGEREIFGRQHVRRRRRRFEAGSTITAFADLKVGDYIVHEHHGIGRYLGLRRFAGKAGDFLALEYSNGDKLYVPVTNVDAIQRYTGAGGSVPKIDRIGGSTWAKTRARVRKAVRDMTEELVKLYAHREADAGIVYARDTPWQDEFEDSFEYDETPDQLRAITEVKRDMESPRPMDRLICGDVGFGKTEVALRAAFKAVMGGKQVAVLVPTTVLAEQHYLTFKERVAGYPIQVDMLSRFRSAKQQKATLEKLAAGEVDIIVGTHRLLSKDAKFSDLGLLVIDEEQRFGVAQKEKVKQMRTHVDVLTLTATPIPRTLNMALLDVRDMSVINTAPNDRLPIHTCIHQFDEALIREAIQRELAREGQVFFVHNRVHNILPFANLVRRLVPGARVAVGHGQMPEHELEDVMTAFIHGEVDVLVCTTIIGSGIDIPNANTIIINNADHFGLAELYQLRGRVGRYKHRAFAYLLVPGDRALTEDAQKRLKALEDFAVLGSGFGIALRDLEIRGCGNILGGEQHGQIASVGYDTYIQLIQEAVADMKGEAPKRVHLPPCDIAIDAFIPEAYVPSETQKITLYKRIAGVKSLDEVEEMRAELGDRFGPPPTPVKRLLDVMRVRAWAGEVGVKRIIAGAAAVAIEFEEGRYLSRKVRTALEQQFGGHVEFAWQKQPTATLTMDEDDNPLKVTEEFLKALDEV